VRKTNLPDFKQSWIDLLLKMKPGLKQRMTPLRPSSKLTKTLHWLSSWLTKRHLENNKPIWTRLQNLSLMPGSKLMLTHLQELSKRSHR